MKNILLSSYRKKTHKFIDLRKDFSPKERKCFGFKYFSILKNTLILKNFHPSGDVV